MDVERTIEFLRQQQADFEAREAAAKARSDERMSRIEEDLAKSIEIGRRTGEELRRAVRLSVMEARAERKRRKEADAKLAETDARLAAGQEALRQSLQAFIDS